MRGWPPRVVPAPRATRRARARARGADGRHGRGGSDGLERRRLSGGAGFRLGGAGLTRGGAGLGRRVVLARYGPLSPAAAGAAASAGTACCPTCAAVGSTRATSPDGPVSSSRAAVDAGADGDAGVAADSGAGAASCSRAGATADAAAGAVSNGWARPPARPPTSARANVRGTGSGAIIAGSDRGFAPGGGRSRPRRGGRRTDGGTVCRRTGTGAPVFAAPRSESGPGSSNAARRIVVVGESGAASRRRTRPLSQGRRHLAARTTRAMRTRR